MWSKLHANILRALLEEFDKENIKFLIDRGYEGLPEVNHSKDVDILVKPKDILRANKILLEVFKSFNLVYYNLFYSGDHYVYRAVNIENNIAIHIDLFIGTQKKGVEIIPFEELYAKSTTYNGFHVINKSYEGVRLFVAKLFGMSKPYLKKEYQDILYQSWKTYPEFASELTHMLGKDLYAKIEKHIADQDFEGMLTYISQINKRLLAYSNKRQLLKNIYGRIRFYFHHIKRFTFCYRKNEISFAVIAPDGAGKTTFLDSLLEKLEFYYVASPGDKSLFHIYHHRPELLPNIGAVGEKMGVAKQDKNFTNPHRGKPVGFFNAFMRICYYWLDYVLGWNIYVPQDVRMVRFSVFDRYSYDLLVDPKRTRISSLPLWLRKVFVKLMPHPKVTFYLDVDPNEIYRRKQELTLEEIRHQVEDFRKIANKNSSIKIIDGNRPVNQMVDEAIIILFDKYWKKL